MKGIGGRWIWDGKRRKAAGEEKQRGTGAGRGDKATGQDDTLNLCCIMNSISH